MTIPAGSLKASTFRNEFGARSSNGRVSLGAYRVNQDVGGIGEMPLDPGIPQSGTIKYSQFDNKKLNIVVDFYGGSTAYRQNAATQYDAGNVTYVGNFYTNTHTNPPDAGGNNRGRGKAVIIHVNKTIGSDAGNANRCALRTGFFSSSNGGTLKVDVGSNGRIYGAGGNGGAGGGDGANGANGTSALGVERTGTIVNIQSGGYIQAGYGGGGGGGEGYDTDKWDDELGMGGGGGGGAGLPVGEGGAKGDGWKVDGTAGADGTNTGAGEGGAGGNADNEAIGGTGGDGGSPGEAADDGGAGQGDNSTGSGGEGGGDGAAVRRTNNNISITYIGETDRIVGSTNVDGVG